MSFRCKIPQLHSLSHPARSFQLIRTLSQFPNNTTSTTTQETNDRLIVVGSGVAGCTTALVAAEKYKIPVTLLYAGSLPTDCNSYWAQGGIIYRNYSPQANDSAESLVRDIQRAGAGLCQDDAIWKLANEGPSLVQQILLDESPDTKFCNVPFDRVPNGSLSYTLEASHSAPRIIHFADHTGKVITDKITSAAIAHPNITVVPNTIVTDLLVSNNICMGVQTLDTKSRDSHTLFGTRGTVLASGGVAGIYAHSTNPRGFNALGSSIALALRAGASTSDLEYIQFHPTVLYVPNQPRFLLTEALRGEGAILRNKSGHAFAKEFHSDGELAPRDIVSRGVFYEMQKSTTNDSLDIPVCYLDITHRDSSWLQRRFPSIDAHLRNIGLDITKDRLPITPAAHYTCGGVTTDLNGRTNLVGLYSAGEAARTGLHGGNRLASTSLLEGLVFGAAVADFVGATVDGRECWEQAKQCLDSTKLDQGRSSVYNQNQGPTSLYVERATTLLGNLKRTMWDNVGVVRTIQGLHDATIALEQIKEEALDLFEKCAIVETAALRDAAISGEAVALSASANKVSAGAHCIILNESVLPVKGSAHPIDESSEESASQVRHAI